MTLILQLPLFFIVMHRPGCDSCICLERAFPEFLSVEFSVVWIIF